MPHLSLDLLLYYFVLYFVFQRLLLMFCSSDQSTALHEIALNGQPAVCELLIASKADVDAKNRCAYLYVELLLILCCVLFINFASNFLF